MTRQFTNKLVELLELEYLSNETVLRELLTYLSENEVRDFYEHLEQMGYIDSDEA